MASLLTARNLMGIVREINLEKLKNEAEQPLRIVLTGDVELARQLALKLGAAPTVSVLHDAAAKRVGDVRLEVTKQAADVEGVFEVELELSYKGISKRLELANLDKATLISELAPFLLDTLPAELNLPLARQVPLVRTGYAKLLIDQTSASNAVVAASAGLAGAVPVLSIPIGLADIVVLTKNQLVMAYKLALAEGKTGKPTELMGEIVSVLGGGLLFREAARKLVGLVPVFGFVPKIAVAYGGTYAIGQVVHVWAAKGETVSANEFKKFYAVAREKGEAWARNFRKRSKSDDAQAEAQEKAQLEEGL